MLRRNLLKTPAMTGLLSLLGQRARAGADDTLQAFHRALSDQPWLQAYRSVPEPGYEAPATIRGTWPADLRGSLWRTGPARYETGDFRAQHWFDGDGMIQAFRLDGRGVRHQARMVATHKFLAEQAAGRALYAGFGTRPPDPRPVTSADTTNTANISVLPQQGHILALWEAGSPWQIDPDSLETRGLHTFSAETRGVPFSAHPRVEPDGTVWNFGYASGAGLLVLWHLDAGGRVKRTGTVRCAPMGMPHDFVVTRRHLVIPVAPFHYEPDADAATFVAAHRWHPERPTRVLVVDKNDFANVRWLELPAQWVFHYGNGWEDNDGVIHFDGARSDDPADMVEGFARVMRGQTFERRPSSHTRYTLDLRAGTAQETAMLERHIESEFPVIDPRVSTRRNERLVMLTRSAEQPPDHPLLDTVSVVDQRQERLQSYRYPAGVLPEEHLFVPAPGSAPETAGWVLGSALDTGAGRTQLNVFDVQAVDAGPLATAVLPYALPLGLHGKFVPA